MREYNTPCSGAIYTAEQQIMPYVLT